VKPVQLEVTHGSRDSLSMYSKTDAHYVISIFIVINIEHFCALIHIAH